MHVDILTAVPFAIPVDEGGLEAELTVPPDARGLVIFAHGCGSGRHSERDRQVARELRSHGFATLLADLFTDWEKRADRYSGWWRSDAVLQGERVTALIDWARSQAALAELPLALVGASTGAAAALLAAAERPESICAIVSRGGRPDLAVDRLNQVHAPTVLLVGEKDERIRRLNHEALKAMSCPARLEVVPDATHLFTEPGARAHGATRAAEWIRLQMARRAPVPASAVS
jgi:dienelactone hydrolase